MNIVFAGTPQFAADHLKLLVDSRHEIKCILTQPDRGSGRGKKVIPSPVKEIGINFSSRHAEHKRALSPMIHCLVKIISRFTY